MLGIKRYCSEAINQNCNNSNPVLHRTCVNMAFPLIGSSLRRRSLSFHNNDYINLNPQGLEFLGKGIELG